MYLECMFGSPMADTGYPNDIEKLLLSLFNCTKVTDVGLKELTALIHLRSLRLEFSQVTDVGLKELPAFKQLQALLLMGCNKVTDVGGDATKGDQHGWQAQALPLPFPLPHLPISAGQVDHVARPNLLLQPHRCTTLREGNR